MVLVTGFEPFGGDSFNPSAEIALALNGRQVAGQIVRGVVLPCIFGQALVELRRALRRERPVLVICLGLAGGRNCLSLERVAINVNDARIPDNAGAVPVDEAIVAKGPVAYWSTLPIKAIRAVWEEAGVPVEISQTAGTFVCNHVFYGLMRSLARSGGRGGFVHVPPPGPGFGLGEMVRALEMAIEVSLSVAQDLRVAGGALS
ncbi:MAG: pyroglutamyl-peptidase I [Candidatus Eremiobacteraeota bacterium]|nr:pyroglutamyl-peptidase I [Candidatus Eremiobacteraeota bacterium]MCW5871971.1 pyroglutamyl-peptidase I [Candidatus Eremiobacteraeota bacterium]